MIQENDLPNEKPVKSRNSVYTTFSNIVFIKIAKEFLFKKHVNESEALDVLKYGFNIYKVTKKSKLTKCVLIQSETNQIELKIIENKKISKFFLTQIDSISFDSYIIKNNENLGSSVNLNHFITIVLTNVSYNFIFLDNMHLEYFIFSILYFYELNYLENENL